MHEQPTNNATAQPTNNATAQAIELYEQALTPAAPAPWPTDQKMPRPYAWLTIATLATSLLGVVISTYGGAEAPPPVSCAEEVTKVVKLHSDHPNLKLSYDDETGVRCHLDEVVRQISVQVPTSKAP